MAAIMEKLQMTAEVEEKWRVERTFLRIFIYKSPWSIYQWIANFYANLYLRELQRFGRFKELQRFALAIKHYKKYFTLGILCIFLYYIKFVNV